MCPDVLSQPGNLVEQWFLATQESGMAVPALPLKRYQYFVDGGNLKSHFLPALANILRSFSS